MSYGPNVFTTKSARAGLWKHRGVSFTPYTDNTNFRTYNQTTLSPTAAIEVARILAVPCVDLITRKINGVVIDGQKRGAECDADLGLTLSRCGKPRSRAGVELTGVFQSAVPVYGVVDRFLHVTTRDTEGRSIAPRVPVAAIAHLYPRASRVVAADRSVSPHNHVSTQLDKDNV